MDCQITIDIPANAKIVVSRQSPLSCDSILYTVSDTEEIIIPIASGLGIKPEEIFRFILRVIGDNVAKDDVLAQKKGLFGTNKVLSPVEGILSSISHDTGEVTILVEKSTKLTFKSPVEGVVTLIDQNKGNVVVAIPTGSEFEAEEISGTAGGIISFINVDNSSATATQINGKVVIVNDITPALASKFDALGGRAFVYLTGTHTSELPNARLKSKAEFDKIIDSKKEKIVLLPNIRKIIVY